MYRIYDSTGNPVGGNIHFSPIGMPIIIKKYLVIVNGV